MLCQTHPVSIAVPQMKTHWLIPLLLAVSIFSFGIYRYGLIDSLVHHYPGYKAMTLFTIMLLMPVVSAFHWKTMFDQKHLTPHLWNATMVSLSAMALVSALFLHLGVLCINALLLGLMEALLVPNLQSYFQHQGRRHFAAGNMLLFGYGSLSLLLAPTCFTRIGTQHFTWVALLGATTLYLLRPMLAHPKHRATEPTSSFARPTGRAETHTSVWTTPTLILVGIIYGGLSVIIYPLAIHTFDLGPLAIGLFAATPMFSEAVGARLAGFATTLIRRGSLYMFIILPAAFFFPLGTAITLLLLFLWCLTVGHLETYALYNTRNLNHALSLKAFGLITGILVSGFLADHALPYPLANVSLCFFVSIVFIGALLWIQYLFAQKQTQSEQ